MIAFLDGGDHLRLLKTFNVTFNIGVFDPSGEFPSGIGIGILHLNDAISVFLA